ncbi:MAG: deoxyribose-phosphate aldolase [Flavobacteriia bacterium]|nr:MAG: deoxyribose-phosphate aldolase [Flavobacteriia bacterium]
MKYLFTALTVILFLACKENAPKPLTAQEIVDKSIETSGGELYKDHSSAFTFRDKTYHSRNENGKIVLDRVFNLDSVTIRDVKNGNDFGRYMNDSLIAVPDSMAVRYANSVNSVHYFARLPYGLNDGAVNKELLGKESIGGKEYYKVKVTFDQQGGGDDFDDTYLYWFNIETFKPDYLAYDFHVNGGGQRFRKAYNERYVNGIRFVDYENYKPKSEGSDILGIGQLFDKGGLELLSKIELTNIQVD